MKPLLRFLIAPLLALLAGVQQSQALSAPALDVHVLVNGALNSVTLSWLPVQGAELYHIYSRNGFGEEEILLASTESLFFMHHTLSDVLLFRVVAESTFESTPSVAAPQPLHTVEQVLSLFSNAYSDHPVDTWSAWWDQADVQDLQIEGDDTKLYTNLSYAGVEFTTETIDALELSHLHLDVWTPGPTAAPAAFRVKLVDFGANGVWDGGGDDVEDELAFNESTDPPLSSRTWASLDIPLAAFTGLVTREHLAQLLFSGDPDSLYVDNVYFWSDETVAPTEPQQGAPLPEYDQEDVLSLFSDSYSNHPVDTWSASWDQADVADDEVQGNAMKHYTNLNYAGIEFTSNTIDLFGLTHIHMDVWTPDPTALPVRFGIRLVDFGADGVYGGGDDSEHDVNTDALSTPPLETGAWVGIDIAIADFSTLAETEHLAQLLLLGDLNTLWVDNVYFYNDGSFSLPTEPQSPAPSPQHPAAEVIALFSDAYPEHPVDSWSADHWPDMADLTEIQIEGNAVKLYTNLSFAGIEFATNTVDASYMTHFHMDIWTPDPTDAPAEFSIKLVDFGADGVWQGGDDVEDELHFSEYSSPALSTGRWISFDLPLSDFSNLISIEHMAQLVLSADPNTIYVDNVYFYNVCYSRSTTPLIYFR